MTSPDLTPRSQAIWAAELESVNADRSELARRLGTTRQLLARMLTCRSRVTDTQARGLHAFTMEGQP
jgi:hypothetical protein